MKKIVSIVLLLFNVVSFSQNLKVDENLNFSNIGSYEIDGTFFSVLNVKNSKTKQYEYLIYVLKDSVSDYVGKFESDTQQDLELFHKSNNNLVFVFSTKKRLSPKSVPNRNALYSVKLKDYKLLSVNLTNREVNVEKLDLEVPTQKFSSKDYSCFVYIDKEKVKIVTLKDYKQKEESETVLPDEIVKFYIKTKFEELIVVSNKTYSENIGAPGNRLFYNDDNIYMTYLNPKIRRSLILKFTRNENTFTWSGYNELAFGFDKKVKDYNSFLTRNRFYFIAEKGNEVLLSTVDLKNNTIKKYNLNELAGKDTIDKKMLNKVILGFGYLNQVPSLTVYKQKDSDNEIVSISYISKSTYYYDPFFHMQFQQQMMIQHQQMMQQTIRASIPGGFNIVSFPYPFFNDAAANKTLKFIIHPDEGVTGYNGEKFELNEIDHSKDVNLLKKYLDDKIDKFQIKYMSFERLKNEDLYYAYYNKRKDEMVFGILKKEKSN